jgi:hypothetical protein
MISTPQHNQHVATIFRSMTERLAAQRANPYRVRAYRKAADTIEALEEDIADIAAQQALEDLEGIGKRGSQGGQVSQSHIYHSAPLIFYAFGFGCRASRSPTSNCCICWCNRASPPRSLPRGWR